MQDNGAVVAMYNEATERALLACAILEPRRVLPHCVQQGILPEYFHQVDHQLVWEALRHMYDHGELIDEVSVANELQGRGHGKLDQVWVNALMDVVDTATHFLQFCKDVQEHWRHREISKKERALREVAESPMPYEERMEQVRELATVISELTMVEDEESAETVSARNFERMQARRSGEVPAYSDQTIYWPNERWDEVFKPMDPLQGDNLQTICAASGEGKSSCARQIIYKNLTLGRRVVVFQLEGEREDLLNAMAVQESGCGLEEYVDPEVSDGKKDRFEACLGQIHKWLQDEMLFVFEKEMTVEGIEARVRQVVATYGRVDLIVVDYLQQVTTELARKFMKRNELVAYVSTQIYRLAKSLKSITLALVQMNRDYNRNSKAQAGWIAESSRIVMDSTGVLMFAWPDKYEEKLKDETGKYERTAGGKIKVEEHEIGDEVDPRPVVAYLIKRRQGRRATEAMRFHGKLMRYESLPPVGQRGRPKGALDKEKRAPRRTDSVYKAEFDEAAGQVTQLTGDEVDKF